MQRRILMPIVARVSNPEEVAVIVDPRLVMRLRFKEGKV
jgi:hypothetical protein